MITLNFKAKNIIRDSLKIEVFCENINLSTIYPYPGSDFGGIFKIMNRPMLYKDEMHDFYVKLPITTFPDNFSLKITANKSAIIYEPYKILTTDGERWETSSKNAKKHEFVVLYKQ